jgi:hypothetical protein
LSQELQVIAKEGDPFYWSRYSSSASNRKFATTSKGYYVLGPKIMMRGDIICVLFGGKTPFCLRQQDDHYLLVGECYVHGLMNGEAMDMMDRGEVRKKMFKIR